MHVDVAEGYKLRLEMMSRELLALRVVSLMTECEAMECVLKSYSIMVQLVDKLERGQVEECVMQAPVVLDGSVGRPKFEIKFSQLKCLLEV